MPGRKMFPDSIVSLPATPGPTPQGLIVSTADPLPIHKSSRRYPVNHPAEA